METRITGDIERISKHLSIYKLTCLCLCIDGWIERLMNRYTERCIQRYMDE